MSPNRPRFLDISARRWDTREKAVIGKQYFVRQATILFGIAKAAKNPKMSAALMDKAADLKMKVDELVREAIAEAVQRPTMKFVAAIGAGDVFSKGRDFAAWLGLVPSHQVRPMDEHVDRFKRARELYYSSLADYGEWSSRAPNDCLNCSEPFGLILACHLGAADLE